MAIRAASLNKAVRENLKRADDHRKKLRGLTHAIYDSVGDIDSLEKANGDGISNVFDSTVSESVSNVVESIRNLFN